MRPSPKSFSNSGRNRVTIPLRNQRFGVPERFPGGSEEISQKIRAKIRQQVGVPEQKQHQTLHCFQAKETGCAPQSKLPSRQEKSKTRQLGPKLLHLGRKQVEGRLH